MAERVKEQEFEVGFLHGWDGSECIYYTDEKCLYYNDAEAPCHHCHHYTRKKALEIPIEAAVKTGLIDKPKCATCRNALNFPDCCNEDTSGKFVTITECENYEKMTGREHIALRGGAASTEPAHRECKGCIQQPYCAGCTKKYKDFKIKEDGGKERIIMAPDTKRRVEEYMKEKAERENE